MAKDSQGSSHYLQVVGGAYGKRKDLIYEIGVYHNYQLVFQTELRIPLGYEKKTGQAIALPLKQFGLLHVFSSVYLLAKRYQI